MALKFGQQAGLGRPGLVMFFLKYAINRDTKKEIFLFCKEAGGDLI